MAATTQGEDLLRALRAGFEEVLMEHGLHLEELGLKQNYAKRSISLSMKVSGELADQGVLPLGR